MNPLDELANMFMKFPGIGRRQAKRFAYFVIQSHPSFVTKLGNQILSIQKHIRLDPESFQYFYADTPHETRSPLSRDASRDASVLMIVEKDVDIEAIEKSAAYHGKYFVLGGLAPLIDTDLETAIRIRELVARIEKQGSELKEIIFALAANPEGDRTTTILKQRLQPLQERLGFSISQLGRGFSTGTEVEYSDADTLANALLNRK